MYGIQLHNLIYIILYLIINILLYLILIESFKYELYVKIGIMSNKSILQFPNKQQFIVTLPKGLVLAKGWKQGDKLEFIIDNKGEIIIKKS